MTFEPWRAQARWAERMVLLTNTVPRLALLADHGTVEDYLELLHPDVRWSLPGDPHLGLEADERHGIDDVREGVEIRRARGVQGPGTATKHVITNLSALATGDTTARVDAYWSFYQRTDEVPELASMGRYVDTWRFVDGIRWVLHDRRIIRD